MKKSLQESIQQAVQKTWADAVASINGLEEEMSRRFRQVKERADLHQSSEDLQRIVTELGKRLQQNSEALERRIDESVRSVVTRVGAPLSEELAVLRSRAEQLSGRVEQLIRRKDKAESVGEQSSGEESSPPPEETT